LFKPVAFPSSSLGSNDPVSHFFVLATFKVLRTKIVGSFVLLARLVGIISHTNHPRLSLYWLETIVLTHPVLIWLLNSTLVSGIIIHRRDFPKAKEKEFHMYPPFPFQESFHQ
jgi:hypothetical protein